MKKLKFLIYKYLERATIKIKDWRIRMFNRWNGKGKKRK